MTSAFGSLGTLAFPEQRMTKRKTGSNGGDDMARDLEKRVENLEGNVSTLVTDMAVIKSNYATREVIGNLRVELKDEISSVRYELSNEIKNTRYELSNEIKDTRYDLMKEIHHMGSKISGEIKEFKSLLLWKVGLPFCTFLLAGMAGVIFMFLKLFTEISTKLP